MVSKKAMAFPIPVLKLKKKKKTSGTIKFLLEEKISLRNQFPVTLWCLLLAIYFV
jgi:hypothetical protein